jgi:signal transduction histidine kinase
MRQASLADAELVRRIDWLIRLRWFAVVGVAAVVTAARRGFGVSLDTFALYLTALGIGGYNLIFWLVAREIRKASAEPRNRRARLQVAAFANLQIGVDLLAVAWLLHLSGGIGNPFVFYFIFHMIIASILLSRRASFMHATFAVTLLTLMAVAEARGWIRHYHPAGFLHADVYLNTPFIVATLFVVASTLYLSVFMATSITARLRQGEIEIRNLTRDLRKQTEQLQRAYQRLSDVERAKALYMRKVGHELRSPVASIQSALRVILEGMTGEVSPKSRDMIQRAEARCDSLLKLINDLLRLSRAREIPFAETGRAVNLREIIEKVAGLLSPRAERSQVALTLELPGFLPPLVGDPEGLEQLVTNLIANAIKYTPPKGQVTVTARNAQDGFRMTVSDTGIGIAVEDTERVFDEFYRSPNARTFAKEGTGLGLSIAKAIVDAHQGTIKVHSQLGRGTQFEVILPYRGEPPGRPTTGGPTMNDSESGR